MTKQVLVFSAMVLMSSNSYGNLLQRIETHPGLLKKFNISNQLVRQCQNKNVSSAFADYDLVPDNAGKVTCQLVKRHNTPQCPKGYLADKKICVKQL